MTRICYCVVLLAVFGLGYVLGTGDTLAPEPVRADIEDQYRDEVLDKLGLAVQQVGEAENSLLQEKGYSSVVDSVNSFAVTTGGVDAKNDLELYQRVDPETFALLYAGFAKPEIKKYLGYDAKGRLTYKDKLVQMYSVERLQELFRKRNLIREKTE